MRDRVQGGRCAGESHADKSVHMRVQQLCSCRLEGTIKSFLSNVAPAARGRKPICGDGERDASPAGREPRCPPAAGEWMAIFALRHLAGHLAAAGVGFEDWEGISGVPAHDEPYGTRSRAIVQRWTITYLARRGGTLSASAASPTGFGGRLERHRRELVLVLVGTATWAPAA